MVKSRAALVLVSIVLPFVVLLGSFSVYLNLVGSFGHIDGEDTAYLDGEATIRTCPSTECAASGVLPTGRQITILRRTSGQTIRDSDQWAEFAYGDQTRFVHDSFVAPATNQATNAFWFYFNLLAGTGTVALMLLMNSSRAQTSAARHVRLADALLAVVALAFGVVACLVGFMYARTDGKSAVGFLGDAFTNIGAGFIGAAVTFALFQTLLSRRNVGAGQVNELTRRLDEIESRAAPTASAPPQSTSRSQHAWSLGLVSLAALLAILRAARTRNQR